jgi:hypothetical protein
VSAIVMQCHQRPDGMAVAETTFAGQPFTAASRHGATMALARQLVAAGAPDGPWRVVGDGGLVRFFGQSLHRLATLTVTERDNGGLAIAAWKAREIGPFQVQRSALGGLRYPARPKSRW